jgi:hypothetical protein
VGDYEIEFTVENLTKKKKPLFVNTHQKKWDFFLFSNVNIKQYLRLLFLLSITIACSSTTKFKTASSHKKNPVKYRVTNLGNMINAHVCLSEALVCMARANFLIFYKPTVPIKQKLNC